MLGLAWSAHEVTSCAVGFDFGGCVCEKVESGGAGRSEVVRSKWCIKTKVFCCQIARETDRETAREKER